LTSSPARNNHRHRCEGSAAPAGPVHGISRSLYAPTISATRAAGRSPDDALDGGGEHQDVGRFACSKCLVEIERSAGKDGKPRSA
jgi:hypothetical protein